MKAGDLKRRIIIQSQTITYNDLNEPIPTWGTYATVWADVKINQGREFFGAKKLNAELDGIIKIRYNHNVTELMQVIYDSKTFQIVSPPIHDVDKEWTELHVKAVT